MASHSDKAVRSVLDHEAPLALWRLVGVVYRACIGRAAGSAERNVRLKASAELADNMRRGRTHAAAMRSLFSISDLFPSGCWWINGMSSEDQRLQRGCWRLFWPEIVVNGGDYVARVLKGESLHG